MKVLLATGTAVAISACEAGDIVCDPLPPPLQCSSDPSPHVYFSYLSVRASWRATATGFVIDVAVLRGAYPESEALSFPYDPTANGGVIRDLRRKPGELHFVLIPAKSASQVDLTIPLDCSGTRDAISVRLDLGEAPVDGQSIPVRGIDPED